MINLNEIFLTLGVGSPTDGDLVFNAHFLRSSDNIAWSVSFSYAQLCRIDSFICGNCDKIKHTIFPILSTEEIRKIIIFLQKTDKENYILKIIENKRRIYVSDPNILYMVDHLEKIRIQLENWLHIIILRLHAMPLQVVNDINKLMLLPYGSLTEEEKVKFGFSLDAQNVFISTKTSSLKEILMSKLSLKNSNSQFSKSNSISNLLQKESEIEQSSPPLLRISVERGKEGQKGLQKYKVC
jgi:hypothetical protein